MAANISDWRMSRLKAMRFDLPVNHELFRGIKEDIMIYELYKAVRVGNVDLHDFVELLEEVCVQEQLDLSTVIYQVTPAGESLLHVAAEFGREKIAELIASHYPELLSKTNIRGDTPLHVAARAKNIEVIKVILLTYRNPDKDDFIMSKNKNGNTALHEAVLSKHLDGVTCLLNAHRSQTAQVRYWNNNDPYKSPIYLAVLTGDEGILCHLLQIPFPPNQVIPKCRGNSPLHAAISERNPDLLQKIVNVREELMYLRDENRDTPLHYAAYIGYVEGVRILLNKSTLSAFQRNSNGNFPIHLACERGHVQVVKELLRLKYPNVRLWLNNEGRNILHIAAMSGENNVVKYLLRNPKIHRETVNERDLNGDTPLHLASRKFDHWTLLFLLQDKKIDVNLVNNEGLTARDIVRKRCKIPMRRQEFLSDVILRSAGVPLKTMLRVRRVASANTEWNVKDAANTLILVAILIATVTFAAGFTVPGGLYSSDDPVPKNRGMAVLADQTLFKIFIAFNTVAMYGSTLGSVLLLWIQLGDRRLAVTVYQYAQFFIFLAIITMTVAFMAATRLVVSNNTLLADVINVIGFIFIFFILFNGILAWFPVGSRLPFFRQAGDLLVRIILILFYIGNDIWIGEDGEINQVDQVDKVNQGNQVDKVN